MIYLLDTNMVSYIVKGRSAAAAERLVSLADGEIAAVSAVTVGEIWYGLAKRPAATTLHALMQSFLAGLQVLSWGTQEAEAYGRVQAELEGKGVTLGSMDMMIAAHAISVRATLVTNDRAFDLVRHLTTLNWSTDLSEWM